MSVMNVVRIAKVIALLAFVLPWVAVSCNNVDVATASGIELIQGKMSENPHAQEQMRQQMASQFGTAGLGGLESGGGDVSMTQSQPMPDLGMNYFGVAAAAVIAIGLVLSLIGKGASTARNVLVTSLVGMALVFGTVWWWKDAVKKQGGAEEAMGGGAAASPFGPGGGSPFGGGMGAAGAGMIDSMLQERIGYWLALGALAVAAGAGAVGMRGGAAAAAKPEGEA